MPTIPLNGADRKGNSSFSSWATVLNEYIWSRFLVFNWTVNRALNRPIRRNCVSRAANHRLCQNSITSILFNLHITRFSARFPTRFWASFKQFLSRSATSLLYKKSELARSISTCRDRSSQVCDHVSDIFGRKHGQIEAMKFASDRRTDSFYRAKRSGVRYCQGKLSVCDCPSVCNVEVSTIVII